jgi:PIN domain nuclease of toxin-antitoxin system
VKGYLLDTNVTLLALTKPSDLRSPVRRAIAAGPNVLSAVVYWEVMLKAMKGLLDIDDPRTWWRDTLEQLAATALVIRPEHIAELFGLPPVHKYPFDRMLIAQSAVEGLTLVTSDRDVRRYASNRVRVVG